MFNSNGGYSLADIATATRNSDNFGLGGDGSWLLILFILFAFGGWGGGFGGFGGWGMNGFGAGENFMMWPWMMTQNTDNIVTNGFQSQQISNQLSGLQSAVTSGFGDTALGLAGVNQNICNASNGIAAAISNGFAAAESADNARQMANMQQAFGTQTAITNGLTNLSSQLAQCCCDNRAATQDLKYTVATEACADRNAVSNALRDVLEAGNANTQAILDKLCQQELDALKTQNLALQNQVNMQNLAASQTAQTRELIADNTAQTQYIVNRVAPYPTPAYIVGNPNANYYGCGCGYNNLVA